MHLTLTDKKIIKKNVDNEMENNRVTTEDKNDTNDSYEYEGTD